jgi:hypothetical protein
MKPPAVSGAHFAGAEKPLSSIIPTYKEHHPMSTQPLYCHSEIPFAAALLALAAITACTATVSVPAPVAASVVVVEPSPAVDAANVYAIKTGSYQQWDPANPSVKTTVYFDDYGRKTSTYTVSEAGNSKTTTVVYNNNDGWVTTYVTGSKTAIRTRYVVSPAPAYYSYPVADRKVIEVAEIGGVKCEGWVVTDAGVDTKVWTYKGIPCKVEAGKSVVLQTTAINEAAPTPDEFTIPATVTIQDN